MERNNDFKNMIMRRSFRQYLHFVYCNLHLVCRIMASFNGVFFMVLTAILMSNLMFAIYFKQQLSSTSKLSDDDELDSKNENKVIIKSLYSLVFTVMMFIVNIRLLMATYNKNICSISIWLLVHTTHMLYSLSINLRVGIANGYNSLICLALFNTLLYLLFISLVILFWMSERCTIRISICTINKAATSQESMA